MRRRPDTGLSALNRWSIELARRSHRTGHARRSGRHLHMYRRRRQAGTGCTALRSTVACTSSKIWPAALRPKTAAIANVWRGLMRGGKCAICTEEVLKRAVEYLVVLRPKGWAAN